MNRQVILLRSILENNTITQRGLVKTTGIALGSVNTLIKKCMTYSLIERGCREKGETYRVSEKGMEFIKPYMVDGAVIMAAGFGSRFVPLTFETPKGCLLYTSRSSFYGTVYPGWRANVNGDLCRD